MVDIWRAETKKRTRRKCSKRRLFGAEGILPYKTPFEASRQAQLRRGFCKSLKLQKIVPVETSAAKVETRRKVRQAASPGVKKFVAENDSAALLAAVASVL